jgi:hypothetical protein
MPGKASAASKIEADWVDNDLVAATATSPYRCATGGTFLAAVNVFGIAIFQPVAGKTHAWLGQLAFFPWLHRGDATATEQAERSQERGNQRASRAREPGHTVANPAQDAGQRGIQGHHGINSSV